MQLFVIVICAVAVQSHARSYMDSSEEEYSQHGDYNAQKDLHDIMTSAVESYPEWKSSVSSFPEASAYKVKVTKRIQNSSVLSSTPHLKEKLYKLADVKLQQCLKLNGKELDRHCVGRITGQVMQLIAAVENSSRSTAYTG